MQLVYFCGRCTGFVQQVQIGKEIGKQRLNKLDTRLVWQTPLCSTMQKNVAEAEVHDDDFVVAGSRRALDQTGKTSSGKHSMRESHRLGFGNHCERHAELLNRIVSVGTDSDGRRDVRTEPDIRHAELVPRDPGLEGSKAKPLTTPGFKLDEKDLALRETEVPLESADATRYTSCVMRLSYTSQDRAALGESVKCSARSMADTRKPQRSQEGYATCWGPNTWPFTCFVKLSQAAFRPTLTATSLDVVGPVRAQRAWFKCWRTCCEAHVESSRCNWVDCSRVWVLCAYPGCST